MKKITVLIPCHNEERGIAKVLAAMPFQKIENNGYSIEVIVIDNNSTDRTAEIAEELGARVLFESKQGKGNAMITGFKAVSNDTDFVVMMDGDDTYKPQELLRLIEPLDSGFCEVVVGSRLAGKTHKDSLRFRNRLANWFYTFLVRYFYLANITDVLSGYFAWKKSVVDRMVPHLKANGFALEMEMITKMKRLGFEMYSVPITYDTREGETKISAIKDGLKIIGMFIENFFWSPIGRTDLGDTLHVVKVVSYAYPFTGSGLGNVAQKQAEKLTENGYTVSLVSSNYPKSKKLFYHNNVQYIKIPSLHFLMKFHVPVPIPFITPTFIWSIKSSDVVHVHDAVYPTSAIAVILAKLFRKPIVLTQHVPFVEYPQKVLNLIQKFTFTTIGNLVFYSADQIIVLNEEVKKMLQPHAHKISMLPNGVDSEFFKPTSISEKYLLREKYGFDKDKKIVLFVGRLVPKKGIDVVYDLSSDNYTILCIGAGDAPSRMLNNSNILFLGNKSPEELKDFYQLSDVFILPSYGEGFPLVIQEAMACGLPIITSNQPEYHDYLDKEFVRMVPRDRASFQKALNEVLENEQLREQMSLYSREAALRMHSWDDTARKIGDIYQKTIKHFSIQSSDYGSAIEVQNEKGES